MDVSASTSAKSNCGLFYNPPEMSHGGSRGGDRGGPPFGGRGDRGGGGYGGYPDRRPPPPRRDLRRSEYRVRALFGMFALFRMQMRVASMCSKSSRSRDPKLVVLFFIHPLGVAAT
jgi:hypothetical protein